MFVMGILDGEMSFLAPKLLPRCEIKPVGQG
jgi:hypothetical protein